MLNYLRWHAGVGFFVAILLFMVEQVPSFLLGKVSDLWLVLGMLLVTGLMFGFGYLLGYFKGPTSWKAFLIGGGLMIALTLFGNWLLSWAGHSSTLNQDSLKALKSHGWYLFVLVTVFAPVLEEMIFRGFLLAQLNTASLFISGLLFMAIHVPTSLGAVVIYGGMACIFMGLRVVTDRLDYGLVLHVVNNLIGFILLMFFNR